MLCAVRDLGDYVTYNYISKIHIWGEMAKTLVVSKNSQCYYFLFLNILFHNVSVIISFINLQFYFYFFLMKSFKTWFSAYWNFTCNIRFFISCNKNKHKCNLAENLNIMEEHILLKTTSKTYSYTQYLIKTQWNWRYQLTSVSILGSFQKILSGTHGVKVELHMLPELIYFME